ncbi:MAG TPA: hypothetical protein DCZ55_36975 [Cyanobacteria bacterium UBA11371]|nr:hypothetical protein [Cyanobacteria bacterium UBA11371]HBE34846.1 hypothetical protein [Cyanobacteria bacterium UBA11368]
MSPPPNKIPPSSGANKAQTPEPVVRRPKEPPTAPTPVASAPEPAPEPTPEPTPETATEATSPSLEDKQRHGPIPPPSEPMQYRAIGLVRGQYTPSDEQFTRGNLNVSDGQAIDAVLLGRVMSLVKNHLDLATEHLWVVYPRTRQLDNNLHMQIVGVWEPENLNKASQPAEETTPEPTVEVSDDAKIEDGYFSIRGEVIFQAQDNEQIVVKIRQTPKTDKEEAKYFKLTLKGVLDKKAVGHFWDFQVKRQAEALVIQQAEDIGLIRPKKPSSPRPKRPGGGGGRWPRKPGQGQGQGQGQGRGRFSPRPTKSAPPTTQATQATPEKPIPRPVKRQQPGNGEAKK